MSTEAIDRATIRKRLRTTTQKEFTGAHTKAILLEMANMLGIEDPSGTKDELYDLLVANAGLPDQSLRGASSITEPVGRMWQHCDNAFAEALAKAEAGDGDFVRPRRKDVIESAKAAGIAHHTARTQYQCWFAATQKGTVRLGDLPAESLPRSLQPEPEPAEAVED